MTINGTDVEVVFPKSMQEIPDFDDNQPTFADIETEQKFVGTRLVQLYQPTTDNKIFVLDTDVLDLEDIKRLIAPLWTVWQNCPYDFGTLNMTTEKFDDTLLLARTAYPQWKEFSLDNLVHKLRLDYLYEGMDKKTLQKAGFVRGAYLSKDQQLYAATDVYALSKIWEDVKIQQTREVFSYKVDILSIKYSIEYQQNRLYADQQAVRDELDKIKDDISTNENLLGDLNPNSTKQVPLALGTKDSKKQTLIHLINEPSTPQHIKDLSELVYNQRRLLKRRTMLTSYNLQSNVTRFSAAGAATGRFTSTGGDLVGGINAQQIPRNLQYVFNSNVMIGGQPTVAIHADYSTAELRAGCSIMKDAAMYKELMDGKDLHKVAATLADRSLTYDSVTKGDRQKGKAVSFGLIFGMSAPAFAEYAYVEYGVSFSIDEAKEVKRLYQMKYKDITRYHKYWWNNYKDTPVSTPMGRRNMARLGTDAINFATQGCVAETVKLAVHYMVKKDIKSLQYIYNVVHDAVYLRVPEGIEEYWSDLLVSCMKLAWTEVCKLPMMYYKDIPMPVECDYIDPKTNELIEKVA